jgi:hypothetical protein
MGRPPLPVGTNGNIGFTVDEGPPMRVRARTPFRDFDGVIRQVTKFGASKAAAERSLKLALPDRSAPGHSDITAETTVGVLGKRWLDDLSADRSTNTRRARTRTCSTTTCFRTGARCACERSARPLWTAS